MTLATRLILLVAGALLISLLASFLLIVGAASHWVQTEIDTASHVARDLVDQRLAEAAEEDEAPERLTELLRSLETGYHIQAVYYADSQAVSPPPPPLEPTRLSRLLGVHPIIEEIPVSLPERPAGRVVLTIDPQREVAQVERAIELNLVAVIVIVTITLGLVAIGLRSSLRPLSHLASALSRVGIGDFSLRITPQGPRDVGLLGLQFNRMADQLQKAQARARTLDAQMLAVQERERREIARDLHDELGPCLLAANLDVSALVRLNRTDNRQAITDCAGGLATLLAHMQELVGRMIGRLHLMPTDHIDFPASVQDLVAFWRDRCPEIDWVVNCRPWAVTRSAATVTALLRVVQEALANAVRHSAAQQIGISCVEAGMDLQLIIQDNGTGIPANGRQGIGLAGMRARVQALGGTIEIDSKPGRGTMITVSLVHGAEPADPDHVSSPTITA
jgi:two-component system sensor histidine kinase UhpB